VEQSSPGQHWVQQGHCLGPRGISHIAEKFAHSNNNLQELILCNCRIGHFGAKTLASAALPPSLQRLDLGQNNIGLDGIWKLAGSLPRLVNLESLYLTNNQIGDGGASEIARNLPHRLKILNIGCNQITNVGATQSNSRRRCLGVGRGTGQVLDFGDIRAVLE
jgi:Ran GTPase-activating protein (RanGAP) involved in mRNA processing and transport